MFKGKISKGHNSVKDIGRVTAPFLCISSDGDLYLYKVFFKENFLDRIKVIERTQFS